MRECKIIDRYWSDRWLRVITIKQCTKCGKQFDNLNKASHTCTNSSEISR